MAATSSPGRTPTLTEGLGEHDLMAAKELLG